MVCGAPTLRGRCGWFERRALLYELTHKAIALARQRFDELRVFCRIAQRFAEVVHGLVQAAVKIYKRIRFPETADQILAGN
jgi:hypothetical protein